MRNYPDIGIQITDILLPKNNVDLKKWAVIACDQFTSQPEYWQRVKTIVGDSPSTFHIILPEVYLGTADEEERVQSVRQNMQTYIDDDIFETHENLILVERTVNGKTRYGLMLALDLECYDYNKGSQTLIRATEGTILDRLPPRIKIREGAPLELPHILVLIDDPNKTVIEPLVKQRSKLPTSYDIDLMQDSGKLKGYNITDANMEQQVVNALSQLARPDTYAEKYNIDQDQGVLLFAMGDGNHSLATAKAIWEKIKSQVGMEHPARYAMVEIENVHDEGLDFEPIHRVLFGVNEDFQKSMQAYFKDTYSYETCTSISDLTQKVDNQSGDKQVVGVVNENGFGIISISNPSSNLPVGTLQNFLDTWQTQGGFNEIDYVHGADVVERLGQQTGNLGFFLPAMEKSDLFKTVILDGALPRKTFSMGEAEEKRFYVECRKINP
jgi:uncharacterized protein (DUF1015 family)